MQASKRRLYHKLQIAAHIVQKVSDREIANATKLTTNQSAVLSVLRSGEGETQKQVATALRLHESALTVMINRLIRYGYVTKKRSPADRRIWMLALTKKGIAAHDAVKAPFSRINKRISTALSEDDVDRFVDMLERITAAFDLAEADHAENTDVASTPAIQ